MLRAEWIKHTFIFNTPGGTSRGVLKTKPSWFVKICNTNSPDITGYGECSIIPKLSIDDIPDFEDHLTRITKSLNDTIYDIPKSLPAIRFGFQTALLDLNLGGDFKLFQNEFSNGSKGIPINGLIWMGSVDYMKTQIKEKLESGFKCLKMKIGAINIEDELEILNVLRNEFPANLLEIRVDANGAFSPKQAPSILNKLSRLQIHSIEQPIKQNQWAKMKNLCQNTPIPIALDEDLLGLSDVETMEELVSYVKPQYIILKPGLLGGFDISDQWIDIAKKNKIGWWITSALEGNIGLNAIAQWTSTKNIEMHQGLGTGQVFSNNIKSPLEIRDSELYYNPLAKWNLSQIRI